ncbi:Sec61beta family protein [uncultured archaeon]|nr:Sec61beta family protein [uncultured archaeon]
MVKFTKSKNETGGPTSAIGIMQFFDADSKSPKLSPYFVVVATAIFVVIIVAIKLMIRV